MPVYFGTKLGLANKNFVLVTISWTPGALLVNKWYLNDSTRPFTPNDTNTVEDKDMTLG